MGQVDARHHLEQLAGDVQRRGVAARRHVDLARIGLGISDELGNRCRRHRWIDHHDQGNGADARHRRGVADEIETQVVVDRRVDGVRRHGEQQRVAVRGGAHHRLGADIGAGARPVLDDEWLAQPLRQPLTDEASDDVGRAAGRNRNGQAHRPRRVGLRVRATRKDRQGGGARRQLQKLPARKFHDVRPPKAHGASDERRYDCPARGGCGFEAIAADGRSRSSSGDRVGRFLCWWKRSSRSPDEAFKN